MTAETAIESERRDSSGSAGLAKRLRYLDAVAEHAAYAAALRTLPARRHEVPPPSKRLRACFLSAYPASHYGTVSRLTRWVPHLATLGCDVEVVTPATAETYGAFGHGDSRADLRYFRACLRNHWSNIRRASEADAVLLHRGLFPFSPWQRPTFERQLARLNPRLVYDFYDAIWLQRQAASRQESHVGRWLHPGDKVEEIIRLARVVTVSNELLAKFAREHHSDVRVLPMLLDVDVYQPRRHERRSPVVLGWFGNRFQIPRLVALAPALRALAAEREILVRVVSSEPVEIPGVPVDSRTHPWSEESEREDLAAIDIGLLPLADSLEDRGKSPLKALQYSAAGVPFVATPVALESSVMKPGECFLPARTDQEWMDALARLVDDVALRARLGAAARRAVARHYSFASHAPALLDALRTAVGGAQQPELSG